MESSSLYSQWPEDQKTAFRYRVAQQEQQKQSKMHRPGIEPGAGRHIRSDGPQMATANFTTKPPMLLIGSNANGGNIYQQQRHTIE